MKKLTFLFLFLSQLSFAQSSAVATTISKIDFKQDTIKAVFDWIADNIKYDVKKLHQMEKGTWSEKTPDFRNKQEHDEYLLNKVIKNKKGVCEDYSLLFNSIARELGYEAYTVEGYTKNAKGRVSRKIGHAWNAIKVNGDWKLYDVTWGAGYVEEDKKFVKYYAKEWYEVDADEMIKTHMPYDPIWQLSDTPINYQTFDGADGATPLGKSEYNYNSLIATHSQKNEKEQMRDQVSRSKELGKGIRLIEKWRKTTTKNIGMYEIHTQPELLDNASETANNAISMYNDYVSAKNKKFRGRKWTPDYINQHLDSAKEKMSAALSIYKGIELEDERTKRSIDKMIRTSEKFLREIDKEKSFIKKWAASQK